MMWPDPENMLVMLYTWQAGDCSLQEPYNGDFDAAMKGIKAKALVLPSKTDLYFRKLHAGWRSAPADGSCSARGFRERGEAHAAWHRRVRRFRQYMVWLRRFTSRLPCDEISNTHCLGVIGRVGLDNPRRT